MLTMSPCFVRDGEHPLALTEYLQNYHSSLSVDILKKVLKGVAFKGQPKAVETFRLCRAAWRSAQQI